MKLDDYDCIGFDLDNTLCEYNIFETAKLESELLARYLVDKKGYDKTILSKPFEADLDFFLKGLIFDNFKGNILKLGHDGTVLRACHGTQPMTDEEIFQVYGPERKWEVGVKFCSNPLSVSEGSAAEKIHPISSYFDTPAALVFGRAVDAIDKKLGERPDKYTVWSDLLEAILSLLSRENFHLNTGGYYPAIKTNPQKYLKKCSPQVLSWLKELRKTKKLFLVTGAHVDQSSFCFTQALGADWREYFDIGVFYSLKPEFFTGQRPFLKIEGILETDTVSGRDLQPNNGYSQGNWSELYELLGKICGKQTPKCLYIGDNLLHDIYPPSRCDNCDTIAVVEELNAESDPEKNPGSRHDAEITLKSKLWGSYFYDEKLGKSTFWGEIIQRCSKVCIPNIEVLARMPSDYSFKCFAPPGADNSLVSNIAGYYPFCPPSLCDQTRVNS